jgi:hypothetical protein
VSSKKLFKNKKKKICHHAYGETLDVFSLRLAARQGCLLSLLLFNIVLEVLDSVSEQKEMKGTQIGKKEKCVSWQVTSLSM